MDLEQSRTCTNTVMQEMVLAGFKNKRKLLLKHNVKRKQLDLYIRKVNTVRKYLTKTSLCKKRC